MADGRVAVVAYNSVVTVRPEEAVALDTHDGTVTIVTVSNLSHGNLARYFALAPGHNTVRELPANSPTADEFQADFKGARIMVTNVSPTHADLRVGFFGMVEERSEDGATPPSTPDA